MSSLKRNCEKKKKYGSNNEAQKASSFYAKNNGTKLSPYSCKQCSNIHLTKGNGKR